MIEFSLIMPVYNGEKYIQRSINSIIEQTIINWELIIVNDGSTDRTRSICDEYANKEKRIKVFHKVNGGVSSARNLGINKSNGKYITFIDCDDWIERDFLEKANGFINKKNVSILITGYVLEKKGSCKKIFKGKRPEILLDENIQKEFFLQNKFSWAVCDKFYDRNIIKQHRFNINIKIGEDMLFFWQILKEVNKVGFLPLYKYHYDISASNTMTSSFSMKWFHGLKVKKIIYDEVKKNNIQLSLLSKIVYIIELLTLAKKIMSSKNIKHKKIINIIQKILRKNIYLVVFYPLDNIMTLKQRIGILFVSLPYIVCDLGRIFFRRNDN